MNKTSFMSFLPCPLFCFLFLFMVFLFLIINGSSLVTQLIKQSACNAGDLGWIPGVGKIPWRRERLPTPIFWPGEFPGPYSPWGHTESDATE